MEPLFVFMNVFFLSVFVLFLVFYFLSSVISFLLSTSQARYELACFGKVATMISTQCHLANMELRIIYRLTFFSRLEQTLISFFYKKPH